MDTPENAPSKPTDAKQPSVPPPSSVDLHPLLIPSGYTIATRQIERMGSIILRNFQQDNHGVDFCGLGRIGKSSASVYLYDQRSWLQGLPAALFRTSIPRTRSTGDSAFFGKVMRGMGLRFPERLAGPRRMERLVNHIAESCSGAHARLAVVFFDEANRLLPEDYDYLVDLDNALSALQIRLFIVFVRQLDADGFKESDCLQDNFPSQVVGRFLMESHRIYGLQGMDHVRHALNRYDSHAFWPAGSGISYSAYFAPVAFARDWRLAQQAEPIFRLAVESRAAAHLGADFDWPMKTFTSMVKFLLCNIARSRSDFREFSEDDIRLALQASGFMQLELVRARLVVEPEGV